MAPQFDRPLRDRLRAADARSFATARAATNLVQSDHETKFPGADRHTKSPHRQCDLAASRIAEGVLISTLWQVLEIGAAGQPKAD